MMNELGKSPVCPTGVLNCCLPSCSIVLPTPLMMTGGSSSWLMVLLCIAWYDVVVVGTRYNGGSVGYRRYYPRYPSRYPSRYPGYTSHNYGESDTEVEPSEKIDDKNSSTDLSKIQSKEYKTESQISVNQSLQILHKGKGASETAMNAEQDISDNDDNMKLIVNQSVHQKINHYHILPDPATPAEEDSSEEEKESSEEAIRATDDKVKTASKEQEQEENEGANIAFNIWGNKEVSIRQEGDRVYNTYQGDRVYNYQGAGLDRVYNYGGFGTEQEKVTSYGKFSDWGKDKFKNYGVPKVRNKESESVPRDYQPRNYYDDSYYDYDYYYTQ